MEYFNSAKRLPNLESGFFGVFVQVVVGDVESVQFSTGKRYTWTRRSNNLVLVYSDEVG